MLARPYAVGVEPVEVGEPGPGQVLVETESSAVSAGTELAIYTGIHQWLADPARAWPKFPFVPGYSAVGRVVATGDGADGFVPGERVIWPGRHARYDLVDVRTAGPTLRRIGEGVPPPAAACALLARFPLTALIRSGPILGESVAVIGLGLIGQLALRLYAASGSYPLAGIDPVAFRRERAEATAGTFGVDPSAEDVSAVLRSKLGGALPDIVVDATGAPDAVRLALSIVADGGKVVMVGSPRGIAGDVDFYHDLHGRSVSLVGAHGSAVGVNAREKFPYTLERALRLLVHLLESGRLPVDDLITHHVHAERLGEMYEGLLHNREEFLGVTLHW